MDEAPNKKDEAMNDFGMVELQLYLVYTDYSFGSSRAFRHGDAVFYIDHKVSGMVAWDTYEDFLRHCYKAEVI